MRRAGARAVFTCVHGHAIVRLTVASALVLSAVAARAHDGTAEQIAALTAQIAQQPRNANLLVRRADLYRLDRKWTPALADLDRAERIDAATAAAQLVRAKLFSDTSQWRLAERAATAFLDRQARHVDALLIRARVRLHLRNTAGAVGDFTTALDLRPQPDVYLERSNAILSPGRTGTDAALRSLDEGIARLGPVVTLELEAIRLELELRRYDAALARLERVSAQAARQESWLARRGAILEQAGRSADARAAYRAALDAVRTAPRPRSRASLELVHQVSAGLERLDARASEAGSSRHR